MSKRWSSYPEQQMLTENFRKWAGEQKEIFTEQKRDLIEASSYLNEDKTLLDIDSEEYKNYLNKKRAQDREYTQAGQGKGSNNLPRAVLDLLAKTLEDQNIAITDESIFKVYKIFKQSPQDWKEKYPKLYSSAITALKEPNLVSIEDSKRELYIRQRYLEKGLPQPDMDIIKRQIKYGPSDEWWNNATSSLSSIDQNELRRMIQDIIESKT